MPAKPEEDNKPLICRCFCPYCEVEIAVENAAFCQVCKANFTRCSHCGAVILEKTAVKCHSCGQPLS